MPVEGVDVRIVSIQGKAWFRTDDGRVLTIEQGQELEEKGELILDRGAKLVVSFGDAGTFEFTGPGKLAIDPTLPPADDELESLNAQEFEWVLQAPREPDNTDDAAGSQTSEGWHYVVVLRRVGEDLDGFRPIGAVQNLEPGMLSVQAARLLEEEPLDPVDPDPVDPDPLDPVDPPDPVVPNRPPETQDLYFTIPEDTSIDSDIPGTDPDRDPLTYTLIAEPEHGSVTLDSETGAFVYTPDADYYGPDQFQVAVSDGQQTVNQTTYIEVTPVNDPPVAEDLYLTTPEDTPIPGVITASDVDGDTLTYTVIDAPDFGDVEFDDTTGTFNYQPGPDYVGEDQFTVLIDDGNGGTTEAIVYITVTPLNDPPVTQDLYLTTPEDTPVPGGIVASDIDGDTLTFTVVDQPDFGAVAFNNATGTFEYQPGPDYVGEDQFTVLVDDGNGGTAQAVVYITVTPVQDPAIITGDDEGAVIEDESDPLLRDEGTLEISDPDAGEALFDPASVVAQGDTLGSLSLSSDGAWQYQLSNAEAQYLAEGEQRIETFTVASVDGTTAEITVTVTGVNDTPEIFTASGDRDSASLTETNDPLAATGRLSTADVDVTDNVRAEVISVQVSGNSGTLSNSALLAMLSVNAGDVIASGVAEGAVNWLFNSGNQAFDFLPQDDTLTLEYTVEVTDTFGASATHPVTIIITGTNDAPVITGGDEGEVTEDASDPELIYNGQLEGYDPDGNESAVDDSVAPIAVGTVLGSLSITADGAWTYRVANADVQYLAESEIREERFLITTADGTQHEMIVQIHGRNDAPDIFLEAGDSDAANLIESDSALLADGTVSAADVDILDQATASVLDVSENIPGAFDKALLLSMFSVGTGIIIAAGDTAGDIQWNFNSGTETFNIIPIGIDYVLTYNIQIIDASGATDTHEITITITGTDDKPVFTGGDRGDVTEDLNVQAGNTLTYSDQLLGFDPDYGQSQIDTSIPPRAINAVLGSLVIDGLGNWTYEVDNAATQFLAEGQRNFDLFQVTTVDGATHVIAVQLHGVNDAPVISVLGSDSDAAALAETNASLQAGGTLSVTDVDLRDTVTASVDSVAVTSGDTGGINNASFLSMLSVDDVAVIASGGSDGVINWLFDSENESFNFLDNGDSLVLTYDVSVVDSNGATDEHTVQITITGTNDAPEPNPQGLGDQKNEDFESITPVDISSGFSDADSDDVLSFTATGLPLGLSISSAGIITGTIDNSASVASPYTVVVTATDTQGATATQEFTWVVTNPAPDFIDETTGVDDDTYEYTVYEGVITETATIQAQDPDGDDLSYSILAGNEDGLFAMDAITGEVSITRAVDDPDLGVRELVIEANDGEGGRDLGTVIVTLLNVNDPPIVYPDTVEVIEDEAVSYRVPYPFDIDSPINHTGYELVDDSTLTGGVLVFNADGSYQYDTLTDFEYLAEGERATMSFSYRLQDSEPDFYNNPLYSDPAIITIEVIGVNDAASFSGDDSGAVVEDGLPTEDSGTLIVSDIDNGESFIDDSRTPVPVGSVLGSLTIAANGDWNYSVDNTLLQYLAAGETRDEVFTVFALDGTEHTITVTLTGTNDTPDVQVKGGDKDTVTLVETDAVLTTSGQLSVTDIDVADSVTPSVTGVSVSAGNRGSLSDVQLLAMVSVDAGAVIAAGETSGKINWQFDSGVGDAFDYLSSNDNLILVYEITATDIPGANDTQTVTVVIGGTNDQPVVYDDVVTTDEDHEYINGMVPVADDVDGTVASYTTAGSVASPVGVLTFNADGTYSVDPRGKYDYLAAGESTEFVFSYRAVDNQNELSEFGQITVVSTGVDDPTQVSTGSGTVREDTTLTTSGQLNVFDIDNPDMAFVANSYSDDYGTLTINADGSWSYVLNQNETVDAISIGQTRQQVYTIDLTDGGDTATTNDDNVQTTVTINIQGINDIPTVENLSFTVNENENLELRQVNGADIDGTIQGYGLLSDVSEGALTFQPNGVFRFLTQGEFDDLAQGETRQVTFDYAAADNNGAVSAPGTVTITVVGVDNAPVIGVGSGEVIEDTQPSTTGTITASDIDNPDLEFTAGTYTGAYGDLVVETDGSWTYTLRSANADPLDKGDIETDTISGVALSDGSTTSVAVQITGTNDAPALITPMASYTVDEQTSLTDVDLSDITDIDADDTLGGYYLVDDSEFPAGSLVFNTAGTFDFNPGRLFVGLDDGEVEVLTFTYQAFDSHGALSDQGEVTITITGITNGDGDDNTAIVIEGDPPDSVVVAGGPLPPGFVPGTYPVDNGTDYGDLVVDGDGNWSFTLDPDAADPLAPGDEVVINVPTGGGSSVDVVIIGTNDEPVVDDLSCGIVETGENSTVNGTLTGTDIDGSIVAYEVVDDSGLQGGTITINPDGTFTFDPGTAFDHMDEGDQQQLSFTFRAIDNNGAPSNVGSGCITIIGEDDAPALQPDTGAVIEDSTTQSQASGQVTYTDVDDDDQVSGSVTFTSQTDVVGTYGTFSIVSTGHWVYTLDNSDPDTDALNQGQEVTDEFTVQASNGSSTTVTVTVTGTNDVPVIDANDPNVSANTDEDTALNGVLPEATDVDSLGRVVGYIQRGDIVYVNDGTNAPGELIFYSDGTYLFDPRGSYDYLAQGETTQIEFSFAAVDNNSGVSDEQTVTITITGVDDLPVISSAIVNITENDENPAASGQLTAFDPDDDATDLSFVPANITGTYGALTIDANGNWEYSLGPEAQTLNNGDDDTDVLTVSLSDGSTTTVTVNIEGLNDVPTSDDVLVTVNEDTVLNGSIPPATDVDGTVVGYRVIDGTFTGPGSLKFNNDGTFTFDPEDDFQYLDEGDTATVTFQYRVQDNSDGISDPITVTIEVTGVNDAPTSTSIDNQSSGEGESLTFDISNYFTDVDADNEFTYSATGLPPSLTIDATTGVISGTLDSDASSSAPYDVTVTATDSAGEATSQGFTWNVINPAPDFIGETSGTDDDTYNFAVNEDDSAGTAVGIVTALDPDNDPLQYSITSGNSAGLFVLDSTTGKITLTRAVGDADVGDYSLQVTVDDGEGGVDTATVNIEVVNINDAPLVDSKAITVDEESVGTPLALLTPTDDDGDSLVITVTALPGVGEITLADGSVVALGAELTTTQLTGLLYNAPDEISNTSVETFSYSVDDGQGEANSVQTGSVSITVNPINDAPVAVDDLVADVPNDSTGFVIDVLANDLDADGDALTVISATAQSGSVTINSDGTLTYVPDSDFVGEDRIIYRISDSDGATDIGRVTVNVSDTAPAPAAFSATYSEASASKMMFDGGESSRPARLKMSDIFDDEDDWLGSALPGSDGGATEPVAPAYMQSDSAGSSSWTYQGSSPDPNGLEQFMATSQASVDM